MDGGGYDFGRVCETVLGETDGLVDTGVGRRVREEEIGADGKVLVFWVEVANHNSKFWISLRLMR